MNINDLHDLFFNMKMTSSIKRGKNVPPVQFVEFKKGSWTFDFNSQLYDKLFNRLFELDELDIENDEREKELLSIIAQMPEVFDASRELAQMYNDEDDRSDEVNQIYEKAFALARSYIPENFRKGQDQIPWACIENRPFLRLIEAYGEFKEMDEGIESAIPIYLQLLSWNPTDEQGILNRTTSVKRTASIKKDLL